MENNYKRFSEIFKVLSDPTRLQIIDMICDCNCSKCALNLLENLNITQPTLSYHMKVLEEVGLVISKKEKNNKNYFLNDQTFEIIQEFVKNLRIRKNSMKCDKCKN